MISEFLRAEYLSERFSEQIKTEMSKLLIDEHIILSADIENADENATRKLKDFPRLLRGAYAVLQEMIWRKCDISITVIGMNCLPEHTCRWLLQRQYAKGYQSTVRTMADLYEPRST